MRLEHRLGYETERRCLMLADAALSKPLWSGLNKYQTKILIGKRREKEQEENVENVAWMG